VITKEPEPKWLNPMLLKRSPLGVRVLCELLEAARCKGHCSANDIKTPIPKGACNTVGGVFKKLRGCGLRQTDYREEASRASQHGRKVYRWKVVSYPRLRHVLDRLVGVVVDLDGRKPMQTELDF